jgi:hypothetical protein
MMAAREILLHMYPTSHIDGPPHQAGATSPEGADSKPGSTYRGGWIA